jgi:hypothetical protein
LYGAASGCTGGATTVGAGFPTNQLNIAVSIVFS